LGERVGEAGVGHLVGIDLQALKHGLVQHPFGGLVGSAVGLLEP
jgi:hypothetical protein